MLLKALFIWITVYLCVEAYPERSLKLSTSIAATTCSSSSDCPTGSGCRDSYGHIVYVQEGPWGPIDIGGGNQGICGAGPGPNEICTRTSECPLGYECYREMSGMCCPPKRCVTAEYAEERRAYWANCHPPTCYFPAK